MPDPPLKPSSSASYTSSYGLPSPIASTLAFAASFALPSSRSSSPSQQSGSSSGPGGMYGSANGTGIGHASSSAGGSGSGMMARPGQVGIRSSSSRETSSSSWNPITNNNGYAHQQHHNHPKSSQHRPSSSSSSSSAMATHRSGNHGRTGWHDEAWDSGSDEEDGKLVGGGSRSGGGLSGSTSTVRSSGSGSNTINPHASSGRSSAAPYVARDHSPSTLTTTQQQTPQHQTRTSSTKTMSTFNNLTSVVSHSIHSIGFGSGSSNGHASGNGAGRPGLTGSSSTSAIIGAMSGRNGSYRSLRAGAGSSTGLEGDSDGEEDGRARGPHTEEHDLGGRERDEVTLARPIPMPSSRSMGVDIRRPDSSDHLLRGNAQPEGSKFSSADRLADGSTAVIPPNSNGQGANPSTSHGSTSTISFTSTSSTSFPSSYSPGNDPHAAGVNRRAKARGKEAELGTGEAEQGDSGSNGLTNTAAGAIGLNVLGRAFSFTHISPPSPSTSHGSGGVTIPPSKTTSALNPDSGAHGTSKAIIPPMMARDNTDGSDSSLNGGVNGTGVGSGSGNGGGADWTILETREAKDAEKEYEEKGLVLGNGTVKSRSRSAPGVGMSTVSEGAEEERARGPNGPEAESVPDAGEGALKDESSGRKEKVGKEALRGDHEAIMSDPLHRIKASLPSGFSAPSTPTSFTSSTINGFPSSSSTFDALRPIAPGFASPALAPHAVPEGDPRRQSSVRSERRREKFGRVLRGGTGITSGRMGGSTMGIGIGAVDPVELRQMAWSGIPSEFRPVAWQMLLNYLPLPASPRLATLARKRREYAQLVNQTFNRGMTAQDAQIWHQIEIDVPRTRPGVPLWACETTQRSLERILYVWAIRHPASGYVQGINDLVTPFFEVFLSPYIDCDPELFDCSCLPPAILAAIEADTFWCMAKMLDGIQDNYISQQPGIHRLVRRMSELIKRIDAPLATHLEEQGVEFMQFAFRWMNCLLMREISVKGTIRMWDTYLSEGTDAFSQFHLYVCSAFLVKWSGRLQEMEFQDIIMFLQSLPTQTWTDHDIELLLSEAFVLKSVWQGAENHFAGQINGPLGGGMGGR